jgi:hypothetical protein
MNFSNLNLELFINSPPDGFSAYKRKFEVLNEKELSGFIS